MSNKPICYCCGKPIPKLTIRVDAPREGGGSARPRPGWDYSGNQIVVSRRFWMPIEGEDARRLDFVGVWDGESYYSRFGYFCSNYCAGAYAELHVEAHAGDHGAALAALAEAYHTRRGAR